jgi:hypothetical protein
MSLKSRATRRFSMASGLPRRFGSFADTLPGGFGAGLFIFAIERLASVVEGDLTILSTYHDVKAAS